MGIDVDIAIVGGGAVGASLALALSKCQFKVALLDQAPPQNRMNASQDNRVFALAKGSQSILDKLGVWPQVSPRATPIKKIHVTNKGSFGVTHMQASDFELDALGYMLAASDLQQGLNQAMASQHVMEITPATFESMCVHEGGVEVIYSQAEKQHVLTAALVIACDGTQSKVRSHVGIKSAVHPFDQRAVVANVRLGQSHQHVAYERFVKDSAIALLPHGDDRVALIWSVSESRAQALLSLSQTDFLQTLQDAFGYRLGKLKSIDEPKSYPLTQVLAGDTLSERVVVVGNAHQTLHPVAAQGLNLALRNVAALTDVLSEARASSECWYDEKILARYVASQEKDQVRTKRFTNSLVDFFSAEYLPCQSALRGAAVTAVEFCPPLKQHLVKGVMKGVHHLTRAFSRAE